MSSPAQGYDSMTEEERRRNAVRWQLRAQALEEEIRQNRKVQQNLQVREAELRDFLENAVVGMHWLGPEGAILWANRTELSLLGYEPGQFIGHGFSEFSENKSATADILRRLRACESLRGCELQLRCGDGSFRWVRLDANPYLHNGEFLHARCFVLDITEQKRAAEAQMRLAAIVQSSDDAIASKDLDGIITSWNAAAERILGWKAEEIVGKSILTIIPTELHGDEEEILRRIRAGECIEHFETVRVTKAGELIDVSLTISPVRDQHGSVIGAAKILRDITAQKKLETTLRTTERLASVGRLAATVAHEINNPLEAVTNLIYLARLEPSLPESVRSCLEAADEELQRVSHIARQTLGFYRDTSAPRWLAVAESTGEVIAIYERRFRYKELSVNEKIAAELRICALHGEFKQIVSNLISNAIDASMQGSAISIRAWRMRHPRTGAAGIRFVVADQGIGIPRENQEKIFTPFFTTKKDFGTGLGLWIIRDLLAKKGGSVRCRSRVATTDSTRPSGTVMLIFLPTEQEPSPCPA
jgi:PAS domain S-box-containing protein